MFSTLIDDVGTTTGNNKALSAGTNYNIRFDGAQASDALTNSGDLVIGDINGDNSSDLILGAYAADNNGANSGSAWIIFSTLIDDVGVTTGNNTPLSLATNYNIRFDGGAADQHLQVNTVPTLRDLNADGFSDLVLTAPNADYNGLSSGAVWVVFSTLIDDVGLTTGNIKPLSTNTNYNVRYDGAAAGDQLAG